MLHNNLEPCQVLMWWPPVVLLLFIQVNGGLCTQVTPRCISSCCRFAVFEQMLAMVPAVKAYRSAFPTFSFKVILLLITAALPNDCLAVTSDAGTLTVLAWSSEARRFEPAFGVRFGKSGCLRTVPGQFLAVDGNGRSAIVGTYTLSTQLLLTLSPLVLICDILAIFNLVCIQFRLRRVCCCAVHPPL